MRGPNLLGLLLCQETCIQKQRALTVHDMTRTSLHEGLEKLISDDAECVITVPYGSNPKLL